MLTSRSICYNGYQINVLMIKASTFIYELEDKVQLVESSNSTQVMYIDKDGSTAVITRDSKNYKELLHRVIHGDVVENGKFKYSKVK